MARVAASLSLTTLLKRFSTHPAFVRRTVLWLALLLIVSGARLWVVAQFGSSLPLMDQWDGEARDLYKPWLEGNFAIADLLRPHTESRMLPSKILSLVLLAVNGQWDGRVQMASNAIIFGAMAVALSIAFVRLFGERHRNFIVAVVGCWSALPFAWENTTWGFQSSFYFLIFFSLAGLWGLTLHRPLSWPWWAGAVSALLACVSMASGVVVLAAVLGLEALRFTTRRGNLRTSRPTIAFCSVAIVAAVCLRADFPANQVFRASTVSSWTAAFTHFLAWPYPNAIGAMAINFPIAILLLRYLRRNAGALSPIAVRQTEALLAMSVWVLLQAAGIAYARSGQTGGNVPSRYMDILALGAVVNTLGLLVLLGSASTPWRSWATLAAAGWVAAELIAVGILSYDGVEAAARKATLVHKAERVLRDYVATGGAEELRNEDSLRLIHPAISHLAGLLTDSMLRRILPPTIRPALRIEPESGAAGPFHLSIGGGKPDEISRVWSSETSNGAGVLRSELINPQLRFLRIAVLGALGKKMSLHLRSDSTGMQTRFFPATPNHGSWRTGIVAVPAGSDIRLIARDENAERSFAFAEPIEVGRLTACSESLLQAAPNILLCGLAILVAVGLHNYLHGLSAR